MANRKPKQELTGLEIVEGSFVKQGDNPEAHITLVKNDKSKTTMRKLQDWAGEGEDVVKFMTMDEILAERRFMDEFYKLRGAFRESVDLALGMPVGDEQSKVLQNSVSQFEKGMRGLFEELEDKAPESMGKLKAIVDDLLLQSDTSNPKEQRTKFAEAFEKLELFEMPKAPAEPQAASAATEKEGQMANQTPNLEAVLAKLSDDERSVVADALKAAQTPETPAPAAAPAPAPAAADTTKSAEMQELLAVNKELAKSLEGVTSRLKSLEDRETRATYEKKAREIAGNSGLDTDDMATALQDAYGVSKTAGEAVEKSFRQAAAAAEKGNDLFKEFGHHGTGTVAKEGSADAELQTIAKGLRQEDPRLDEFAAYDKACELNPELAEKAINA